MAEEGYPDTEASFTNAFFGDKYFCFCDPGYETYYGSNEVDKRDTPKEFDSWCNAEVVKTAVILCSPFVVS